MARRMRSSISVPKGLGELRFGFRPRLVRFIIRFIQPGFFYGLSLVALLPILGGNWFVILFSIFSLSLTFMVLNMLSLVLLFSAYFSPRLAFWATRADVWLERDLNWNGLQK